MTSEKVKNELIECAKCSKLWLVIGILSFITVMIFGFLFLDFYYLINLVVVYDLIRYVGALTVLVIAGYISYKTFKAYCLDGKHSDDLAIAGVSTFVIIVFIASIGYYLPITLAENEIRGAETPEERIQLIQSLDCRAFNANFIHWSHDFRYEIKDWNEEKGIFSYKYKFDSLPITDDERKKNKEMRWVFDKYKECKL